MNHPPVSHDDDSHVTARRAMSALSLAFKAVAMFPEGHVNRQRPFQIMLRAMADFLDRYGELKLQVERDRFVREGRSVYEEAPESGTLVAPLFRDGVRSLSFQPGLGEGELHRFFRILHQYRTLREESESDVVTALWEEDLTCLRLDAREIVWENEPLLSFPPPLPPPGEYLEEEGEVSRHDDDPLLEDAPFPDAVTGAPLSPALWRLTPAEAARLREMVILEENRASITDILEVLLVILEEQTSEPDLLAILDFMKEEWRGAMERGEFHLALGLLTRLRLFQREYLRDKSWAISALETFFLDISRPETLDVLLTLAPAVWRSGDLADFWSLLHQLEPPAVRTLCAMLFRELPPRMRRNLIGTIAFLAAKDPAPLEEVLGKADEHLCLDLIRVLNDMNGNRPALIMLGMLRHPAQRVRMEALLRLLHRDFRNVERLFHLIDDDDALIRRIILHFLNRGPNPRLARRLMDHLSGNGFRQRDPDHILACYRTLGKCGDAAILPFLREVLLEGAWKAIFGIEHSPERIGAALALMELDLPKPRPYWTRHPRAPFPGSGAPWNRPDSGDDMTTTPALETRSHRRECQHIGATLVRAVFTLLQTAKIHNENNEILGKCVAVIHNAAARLAVEDKTVEIRFKGKRLLFQGEPLPYRPDTSGLYDAMHDYFEKRELRGIRFVTEELARLSPSLALEFARGFNAAETAPSPVQWLNRGFEKSGLSWVTTLSRADDGRSDSRPDTRENARRNYANLLSSVREVASKIASHRPAGLSKTLRVVQNMVDLMMEDEPLFRALSTVRIYDDYTYAHSVNVAILSMCLGKRILLSRRSLERLSLCALFHDLGKVEIPKSILNKPGRLNSDEFEVMKRHSMNSVRLITQIRADRDLKASLLLPPFEHHLRYDLSGYPQTNRRKPQSLFGRILSIADVYDAITSPRVYRPTTLSPDRALGAMFKESGRHFDPILLKVFINMMGAYPVGTLLRLDNDELGLVMVPSEEDLEGEIPEVDYARPWVIPLKAGPAGAHTAGDPINLGRRDPLTGEYERQIVSSHHPADFGIQPLDFLL